MGGHVGTTLTAHGDVARLTGAARGCARAPHRPVACPRTSWTAARSAVRPGRYARAPPVPRRSHAGPSTRSRPTRAGRASWSSGNAYGDLRRRRRRARPAERPARLGLYAAPARRRSRAPRHSGAAVDGPPVGFHERAWAAPRERASSPALPNRRRGQHAAPGRSVVASSALNGASRTRSEVGEFPRAELDAPPPFRPRCVSRRPSSRTARRRLTHQPTTEPDAASPDVSIPEPTSYPIGLLIAPDRERTGVRTVHQAAEIAVEQRHDGPGTPARQLRAEAEAMRTRATARPGSNAGSAV